MPNPSITHFVFVDFENVPSVNLELIAGKPVHVTVLIGNKQTKLDTSFSLQLHKHSAQVEPVEVGASGRNALDLTLACYLGQAIERAPGAEFFIVSKDKDFDPAIAHLKAKGVKVSRYDAFAALPFLAPAKPEKSRAKTPRPPKPSTEPSPTKPPNDDRLERLVARLKNNQTPRPKKHAGLLARIKTDFGNKLDDPAAEKIVSELVARGVLTIDSANKVSYP